MKIKYSLSIGLAFTLLFVGFSCLAETVTPNCFIPVSKKEQSIAINCPSNKIFKPSSLRCVDFLATDKNKASIGGPTFCRDNISLRTDNKYIYYKQTGFDERVFSVKFKYEYECVYSKPYG